MSQDPILLNSMETFGASVRELLRELEENYPPFTPHPSESQNLIMYKSGQRSVVEWILNRLSEEYNG
jgi:hypothetical protein